MVEDLPKCEHGFTARSVCNECVALGIVSELPKISCGRCLWWEPNRGAIEPRDRLCLKWNERRDDRDYCEEFIGADDVRVNVPQHTPEGTMENFRNATPVDGVQILIVTYAKDFPWLEYAVRCMGRHLRRFQGVTIAIPQEHLDGLVGMNLMRYPGVRELNVGVKTYFEPPGKGFLNHEMMMASAEQLVPAGTQWVMHLDADCMFKIATDPQDYFLNDKPQYIYRSWESLSSPDPRDPTQKIVSDCIMWKEPTSKQLGYQSDVYTMCRHPNVFPIEFYRPYREHIANHHQMSFEQYMLSGERNSHPQDRMDLTAMGQYAWTFMRDRFHWINCATEEYPKDRQQAYHSHSGLKPEVVAEIESFLK